MRRARGPYEKSRSRLVAGVFLGATVLWAHASRAAEIAAGDVYGAPGATVSVPVFFSSPSAAAAFQADFGFDPSKFSPQSTLAGPQLGAALLDAAAPIAGTVRIVVHTPDNGAAQNGILAYVPLTIAVGAPLGEYPLLLSSALVSNPDAGALATSLLAGSLNVRVAPPSADLEVTKEVDLPFAVPGMEVEYTIEVTNPGPDNVSGAVLTDPFPPGLTGVSWSCFGSPGVTCPASGAGSAVVPLKLPSGSTATIVATAVISGGASFPIANTASVSLPVGVGDPVTGNNQDTATIEFDDAEPTAIGVDSVAGTGDGLLGVGELTTAAITQLLLTFSEPLYDPPGDSDTSDATNPLNYRLFEAGANGVRESASCGSPAGDDLAVPIVESLFSRTQRRAGVLLDSSTGLAAGSYRLLACSGGLRDPVGFLLDGNADGEGGDSFLRDFAVAVSSKTLNPNFDREIQPWQADGDSAPLFEYSELDAGPAFSSGSGRLLVDPNDGAVETVEICIGGLAPGSFEVGAALRVSGGGASHPAVEAEVVPSTSSGCAATGQPLAVPGSLLGPTGGAWSRGIRGNVTLPTGTVSALLRVVATAGAATPYEIFLDEAIFRPAASVIFSNGFNGGDTCDWSARAGSPDTC